MKNKDSNRSKEAKRSKQSGRVANKVKRAFQVELNQLFTCMAVYLFYFHNYVYRDIPTTPQLTHRYKPHQRQQPPTQMTESLATSRSALLLNDGEERRMEGR